MKRYRVLSFDFDARVHALTLDVQDHWEDSVKESHRASREQTERGLIRQFGEEAAERKRQNFIDLGAKPLSILAFHNRFFEQVRVAFVMGAYYPALTGACALGERILNHLVLALRDAFKHTAQYKHIYRKGSFDNWELAIDTLQAWDILLPEVVAEFRTLRDRRNDAVHFRPDVDQNDRALALAAIGCLGRILAAQFSAFGRRPWLITCVPGESYVKRAWESRPFISKVYLPNCAELGPDHIVESLMPWRIRDAAEYDTREVTDDEFCELRIAGQRKQFK